jgi:hypothetical protein
VIAYREARALAPAEAQRRYAMAVNAARICRETRPGARRLLALLRWSIRDARREYLHAVALQKASA